MRVIGLHGLPQSGKDTIADYLVAEHNFARIAFAGPIKDGLIAMFGLTREDFSHEKKEVVHPRIGVSPRRLMQTVGTEWGRAFVGEDIWIRVAAARVKHMMRYAAGIVVTDVRYENEAAWVREELKGEVWHVVRSERAGVRADHSSNAAVALYPARDSVILNYSHIPGLHAEIERALVGECLGSKRVAVPA